MPSIPHLGLIGCSRCGWTASFGSSALSVTLSVFRQCRSRAVMGSRPCGRGGVRAPPSRKGLTWLVYNAHGEVLAAHDAPDAPRAVRGRAAPARGIAVNCRRWRNVCRVPGTTPLPHAQLGGQQVKGKEQLHTTTTTRGRGTVHRETQ